MRGTVVDLTFAHTKEEVVVGAVDSLAWATCLCTRWWRVAVA